MRKREAIEITLAEMAKIGLDLARQEIRRRFDALYQKGALQRIGGSNCWIITDTKAWEREGSTVHKRLEALADGALRLRPRQADFSWPIWPRTCTSHGFEPSSVVALSDES